MMVAGPIERTTIDDDITARPPAVPKRLAEWRTDHPRGGAGCDREGQLPNADLLPA